MDYVIIDNPVDNDNRGYKDTGILGHYRWQDVQCLAELFGQANSCIACDARNDAKGNFNQDTFATTLWPFFGTWWNGQPLQASYLQPERGHTWYDRMERLSNGSMNTGLPIPYTNNNWNEAYVVMDRDPFSAYAQATFDELADLERAGTYAGTIAVFGQMCWLKNDNLEQWLQMNRRTFGMQNNGWRAWTSRPQMVQLYQDAKKWSNYQIYVLTWSDDMALGGAMGQPLDMSFSNDLLHRRRDTEQLNADGQRTSSSNDVFTGWGNDTFGYRGQWRKSAVIRYVEGQNKLIYEWSSTEDHNIYTTPQGYFERNVPVPNIDFGLRCLWERKIMLVWKATFRKILQPNSGETQDTTTVKWFYYIINGQKDDVVQTFVDLQGNNRGLCVKYKFPAATMMLPITAIVDELEFEIPEFEQQWVPVPQSYVVSQSQQLDIDFMGAYTLQRSRLTEQIQRELT